MSGGMVERFRRWFEYERDAHAKVIHSLDTVPEAKRTSAEYQRAIAILGHLVAARRVWLGRLGIAPPFQGAFFPQGLSLEDLVKDLQNTERLWSDYLANLTEDCLADVFEYQSLDGGKFRNRIEEILTQLFGHSWYHRGQIAMLIRQAGGEPAITDWIYWCRERVV